ncbi:erythromycin esterase family protein [Paenibacillus sp. 481]|uniref:erythromycin esterase family protein n=1 Tax=Paenibacillus sp. 481 TaxID=2835869 RepID=UPI001E48190E|nr:erythromycin esterase family protein [Paenibacillus sp. 481]UHA74870.1 erythromycin esterase family protein [Paenibacillus sp. 481]
MDSYFASWKRRSLQVMLASVMALGTLLSFSSTSYGQGASTQAPTLTPTQSKTAEAVQTEAVKTETVQAENVQARPEATATTSREFRTHWDNWIRTNAYSLDSIEPATSKDGIIADDSFKDLDMLKPLLLHKRIVYLGESTHGAAEFNSAKTRLIQFLHKEMGYNVVAFESHLGRAAAQSGNMSKNTAKDLMTGAIYPQWWSEETLPLFEYAKDTQQLKNKLTFAGFDINPAGAFTTGEWMGDEALVKRFIEAESQYWTLMSEEETTKYDQAKPELLKLYDQINKKMDERAQQLQAQYPDNPHIVKLMKRAVEDRKKFIEEYIPLAIASKKDQKAGVYESTLKMFEWRDKAMADNLYWLATEIYPTERIVVWGHNTHINKANSNMKVPAFPGKMMGELMQDTAFKDYSYSIGLYMGGGQHADNVGKKLSVPAPAPNSIESIMKETGRPYSFVDLRYHPINKGNSWMTEERTAYYFGMYSETFVPREQFDGILFIDQVKAPKFLEQ